MSNEQHPTKGSLVPTGNRGLTTRSGALVRRGLDTLRNIPEQPHRGAGNESDKQGQCAEAEQLEEQAMLPLLRGEYIQAEPLLKSALGIWEKVLGPYS